MCGWVDGMVESQVGAVLRGTPCVSSRLGYHISSNLGGFLGEKCHQFNPAFREQKDHHDHVRCIIYRMTHYKKF